jgi:hypothetical protein
MANGVVPLPKDKAALIAQRKVMRTRTLNDYVDEIHVKLWGESSVYMRLLDAVDDAGTVEGSTAIDNIKAAECIRDYARNNGIQYVAEQRLRSLVLAMNVVLARYSMTRQERAKG